MMKKDFYWKMECFVHRLKAALTKIADGLDVGQERENSKVISRFLS